MILRVSAVAKGVTFIFHTAFPPLYIDAPDTVIFAL
jgi:hypothetical protein